MAFSDEEEHLLARLAFDAQETPRRFRRQGMYIVIGSVVVAGIAAAREMWPLVPMALLFGAAIYWLGRVAAKKNGPERSEPVLRALREAPERVLTIGHTETSDSLRVFVSHWVVVTTADGQLRVRADDWKSVMATLERRCPGARVARG